MKEQIHLAAQYLAAAGISFLEKRDDDSHTNLGFNIEKGTLDDRKWVLPEMEAESTSGFGSARISLMYAHLCKACTFRCE